MSHYWFKVTLLIEDENQKRIFTRNNNIYRKIAIRYAFNHFIFLKINTERDFDFLFKKGISSNTHTSKKFCNYTSRARGLLTVYGMSRMQFKRFACLGFFYHLIKRGH